MDGGFVSLSPSAFHGTANNLAGRTFAQRRTRETTARKPENVASHGNQTRTKGEARRFGMRPFFPLSPASFPEEERDEIRIYLFSRVAKNGRNWKQIVI